MAHEKPPIDVVDLILILDSKLIELLKSLSEDDWIKPTIAKLWNVKDVTAHLLDGSIRNISVLKDSYFGEQPSSINSYCELVDFLNQLNADWVRAMKRVSPSMLILLHEIASPVYYNYLKELNPFDDAIFSVAWTGETVSKNWKHIAREYTEKFHHQQQIREAVDKPGIMTRELFYPFIDTLMLALPNTYKNLSPKEGTTIKVTVTTEIGGSWYLTFLKNDWNLTKEQTNNFNAEVLIPPDIAWKLFTKSIRPDQIKDRVVIKGEEQLGSVALSMISVMA